MGFRGWFRRASKPPAEEASPSPSEAETSAEQDWARRLLEAYESGELAIPSDIHDRPAWNRYWRKQMELRSPELGFNDTMASDPQLLPLLHSRGVTTILCAGIGLSSEAVTLFLHGFDVTALDISDVPREMFRAAFCEGRRRLPGLQVHHNETVSVAGDHTIEPHVCPPMHRVDGYAPRAGGSLSYVTGDLIDPQVCPGPFDVVIERRTVQLFPPAEQALALDRLAARLGSPALLISHQHQGNWKPRDARRHFAEDWAARHDFVTARIQNLAESPRLARLVLSTG